MEKNDYKPLVEIYFPKKLVSQSLQMHGSYATEDWSDEIFKKVISEVILSHLKGV
jgi:hypothetical protein